MTYNSLGSPVQYRDAFCDPMESTLVGQCGGCCRVGLQRLGRTSNNSVRTGRGTRTGEQHRRGAPPDSQRLLVHEFRCQRRSCRGIRRCRSCGHVRFRSRDLRERDRCHVLTDGRGGRMGADGQRITAVRALRGIHRAGVAAIRGEGDTRHVIPHELSRGRARNHSRVRVAVPPGNAGRIKGLEQAIRA